MIDVKKLLEERMASDPRLRAVVKRINAGRATFADTAYYSEVSSGILGRVFGENVLKISEAEREALCMELLKGSYERINQLCQQVQQEVDREAGIHIRPRQAAFPEERAAQLARSLVDRTVGEEVIKRRAASGSGNISRSFHDDYIERNAKFRSDAGLKCYITRTAGSSSCPWCAEISGKFEYDNAPEGVFRRHDNCSCTVVYDNGRTRQNLRGALNEDGQRTKKWEVIDEVDVEPPKRFSSGDQPQGFSPTVLTGERKGGKMNIRGSGNGSSDSNGHTFEKIGDIDFSDKKAIAKSLAEFENTYSDSHIEHCRVFCTNGEVYEVHGDRYTVDTSILGEKLKGSINEHNHVIGESQYSFSWEDLLSSSEDGSATAIAFDEKYRYSMTFPDKNISADVLSEAYDISEYEVQLNNYNYQYYLSGNRISDEDYQHEVIKRTCERVGVKYERKLKA